MEQVSRSTDETQAALLAPYELCRVDVTTEYGKRVAAAFKVSEFPYTAIIDRTASVILYRKTGRFDTAQWASTLIHYQNGDHPRQARICFT